MYDKSDYLVHFCQTDLLSANHFLAASSRDILSKSTKAAIAPIWLVLNDSFLYIAAAAGWVFGKFSLTAFFK